MTATGSITTPAILDGLLARLERPRPDTPRQWGTMTASEMVRHLSDCSTAASSAGRAAADLPHAVPFSKRCSALHGGAVDRRQTDAGVGGSAGRWYPPGETSRQTADRPWRDSGLYAAAADAVFPSSHAVFGTMTPT